MFICADSVPEEEARLECIGKILKYLPQSNMNLLRMLCTFLKKVMDNSSKNKMTADNLGIVFAPNLLRPREATQMMVVAEGRYSQSIMSTLITKADKFFPPEQGQNSKASETEEDEGIEKVIDNIRRLSRAITETDLKFVDDSEFISKMETASKHRSNLVAIKELKRQHIIGTDDNEAELNRLRQENKILKEDNANLKVDWRTNTSFRIRCCMSFLCLLTAPTT
eukprot:GEZU01027205.1.p1 GENE.GEZU01027205.1~~GEZU01027205.1.p1  ORF type:complete len:224 (-),score=41.97 GEZU01027205.1:317-988(-)